MNDYLDAPIETLDLSPRAYNALKRSGLLTVQQVLALSDEELRRLRNLGSRAFIEIKVTLVQRGYLSPDALPPMPEPAPDDWL